MRTLTDPSVWSGQDIVTALALIAAAVLLAAFLGATAENSELTEYLVELDAENAELDARLREAEHRAGATYDMHARSAVEVANGIRWVEPSASQLSAWSQTPGYDWSRDGAEQ